MNEADILAEVERRYRWRRLNISFSGGQTSADMTKRLVRAFGGRRRNVVITFANTGDEDERTLRFVHEVDQAYDLGVVWLEAVVDPRPGFGSRHKVVTYETASRTAEPFERVIEKYGLPGPGFLHCTRELKINPIRSYLRSIGWEAGTYDTAIGIRADEVDRMDAEAKAKGFVYLMVKLGLKKEDVIAAFVGENVQLDLPEALGNCTGCWKKSLSKHVWLMRNHPHVFDFYRRMEEEHAYSGAGDGRRRFFYRKHRTVADIEALSKLPDAVLEATIPDYHIGNACGDACGLQEAA